jgi:hypothetical protein
MTNPDLTVPFDHAYWVVPERLLAGPYPASSNPLLAEARLRMLLDTGITQIFDLTEVDEMDESGTEIPAYAPFLFALAGEQHKSVRYQRFPIPDFSIPSRQQMRLILDAIDEALAQGKRVYLHCQGGRGRTGSVVGCFLARHGVAEGDDALARIGYLRRFTPNAESPSPETDQQIELVKSWREGE